MNEMDCLIVESGSDRLPPKRLQRPIYAVVTSQRNEVSRWHRGSGLEITHRIFVRIYSVVSVVC